MCHLLRDVGVAGYPGSHFHRPSVRDWLAAHNLNQPDYPDRTAALKAAFGAALKHGKGQSAMFGLRLQQHSLDFFMEQVCFLYSSQGGDLQKLEAAFGKTRFVYLKRQNKLDQAISYIRAEQSGLWHRAADGSELERLAPPSPLHFNRARIARQIVEFEQMDLAWERWFSETQISPLRLTYDELSQDPNGTLAQVLEYLGIDATRHGRKGPVPVAKLADALNQDWAEQYLSENQP